jgi:arylformamidase
MHNESDLLRRLIGSGSITRRMMLGAAAAVAATPAFAEECHIGPPAHAQGPRVWLDMDQVELDAAYDQSLYAPLAGQIRARFASGSEQVRARLGPPATDCLWPERI